MENDLVTTTCHQITVCGFQVWRVKTIGELITKENKVATPKQIRAVMKKIYYYQDKLQDALTEAHNMDVIQYDSKEEGSYHKYAPCSPAYECRERVRKTTEAALAEAMRTEIKRTIK